MIDYIKREDALDIVADNNVTGEITLNRYDKIIDGIYDIPSADVAPVRHEEDGTLWVTVRDCETVGRVIVRNEQGHFCRVFYMGDGDEEPVRHGRWLEYGENKDGTHNIRCSKCGAGLKSKGHANSYYTKRKYRYCRNCGTKMDEVEDND